MFGAVEHKFYVGEHMFKGGEYKFQGAEQQNQRRKNTFVRLAGNKSRTEKKEK